MKTQNKSQKDSTTTSTKQHSLHQYLKDAGVLEMPAIPDFPMTLTPMPHQVEGLRGALQKPRFGLFDSAGTGKTIIMQAYALYYIGWGNKVVCAMPPVLCEQFQETLGTTFVGTDKKVTSHILVGAKSKTRNKVRLTAEQVRAEQFAEWDEYGWPNMLLMSYEMFDKNWKRLKKAGYDVLITDEAQKLRGSESNIHATVYNYTEEDDDTALLLATGTPLHHTPVDGYAMSRLLDRETYLSLKSFKRKHCDQKKFYITTQRMRRGTIKNFKRAVYEITGYRNLDLLSKNLYKNARRVTKDQVLTLEDPTIIPIDLKLGWTHQKLYKKLEKERMLEIGDRLLTATQAQTLRESLMGIVCNPEDYSVTKVRSVIFEMVDELLDSIGDSSKVLMYAHHNRTLETLADRYADLNPALVYGGKRSSASKNLKQVGRIKNDNACRIGLLHPKSGGVGLDFQHVSNYVIVVEPTSIQGDFTQLMARVQRQGQKHPVVVYVLRVAGTVYPGMVKTMLDNNVRAARVNDDQSTFDRWIGRHEVK